MSARWISEAELNAVIGRTETNALCQVFGGREKYLPLRPGPDHEFAPIIGMAALTALAAYAGGWHLELPNLRRPEPEKERIWDLLAHGWTHDAIADACRVSTRWVRTVAAMPREKALKLPIVLPNGRKL